ncbi:MAG: LpxI family protein [Hyphomicrobiaceae bacterium]
MLTKAHVDQPAAASLPISVLACGGGLPLEVAQSLRREGRPTNIVSIAGMADANYDGFPVTTVGIGQTGALLRALRSNGVREIVIAGHARRPDLRRLTIDWGFVRNIATILSLTRGGDDQVNRRIAGFFERNGLIVRGIADVAPALLTPAGVMTGDFSPAGRSAAAAGIQLIHDMGKFDVGQAVVMDHTRLIAIEGAEGTNGLLGRLPPANLVNGIAADNRVLIKAAKPEQDQRVDLPTVGTETIEKCARAGVSTVALEAGRSLIVSRAEMLQHAKAAGIAVVGLPVAVQNDASRTQAAQSSGATTLISHARTPPSAQFRRDACKGFQLLTSVRSAVRISAALIGRENVLALNVGETFSGFVERGEKLAQWGDRREKSKRNRTLVVESADTINPKLYETLGNTKIAGFAILNATNNPTTLDRLVAFADGENYFVLSPQ